MITRSACGSRDKASFRVLASFRLKPPSEKCYLDKVLKSSVFFYRVDPRQVHYVRFILEACDGLGVLSTEDPDSGLVRLTVPPGRESEIRALFDSLSKEFFLEPVNKKGS